MSFWTCRLFRSSSGDRGSCTAESYVMCAPVFLSRIGRGGGLFPFLHRRFGSAQRDPTPTPPMLPSPPSLFGALKTGLSSYPVKKYRGNDSSAHSVSRETPLPLDAGFYTLLPCFLGPLRGEAGWSSWDYWNRCSNDAHMTSDSRPFK